MDQKPDDGLDWKRYESFVIELNALLEKHGLMLATSGYDSIHVCNRPEGDPFIWGGEIENMINVNS